MGIWLSNHDKWQIGFRFRKQKITSFSSNTEYSFEELEKANAVSKVSIVDPYEYQGGKGFTKELNVIINLESQDWHVKAGRTPTDADLKNKDKNTMKVDWFRVFKPKK